MFPRPATSACPSLSIESAMRLTTIKLSGFKSFVDPTVLHLPTNLTGIVGPNGCGKSNIIDAIKWVMGESAASRLRGENITDVIFSGSGTRKPVGAATVELIFDNSEGTIGGEYARFSEISVKRTVSRDAISAYFLNGSRCRRRDIVDVFLGTGLGARSYSIIEQGMISQIVEARPEDLRVHLEEAAGISKYKERRKETESRIKSTRENLARLSDVREEVDKQLELLNRQAKQAERYQKLQAEAVRVEAELKGLELVAREAELGGASEAVRAQELALEAHVADQRHVESGLETHRVAHAEVVERCNLAQREVYQVGAELARIEQQIQHNKELAARLERARGETESALAEIDQHTQADQSRLAELQAALAQSEPDLAARGAAAEQAQAQAQLAEQALGQWQQQWDAYAKASAEASRAAEVERTKLDYLDKRSNETGKRLAALATERSQADTARLSSDASELEAEGNRQRAEIERLGNVLAERKAALESTEADRRRVEGELTRLRGQFEALRGRIASMEALQHAALGQEKGAVKDRIAALGLAGAKRVGEVLDVADGWERAVETVLTGLLDGVVSGQPYDHAADLAGVTDVSLGMFSDADGGTGALGTLAAQVRGPASVQSWLARVRTADTLEQALAIAGRLGGGESVVTPSGEWLGPGWIRIVRGNQAQIGVLARERELHALVAEREALVRQIAQTEAQVADLKTARLTAEQLRDDAQRELYVAHRRGSELAGQLQSQQGRIEAAEARLRRITQESEELEIQRNDADGQARESRTRLEEAVTRMGEQEQQRVRLDGERRVLLERREEARMEARDAQDALHRLALELESKRSALGSLQQGLARLEAQRVTLQSRQGEIATQLATGGEPLALFEAQRTTYLDQRLLADKSLVEARSALEASELSGRELEAARHRIEAVLTEAREALSQARLAEQGTRLRTEALVEDIVALGFEIEALKIGLPEGATAPDWQSRLEDLHAKIRRLEPVNLAAIQQYGEQSERKNYLDAQFQDLTDALETLETAIKKIDKETRTRFKETFDRVNTGLGELFPRLFGGGHAYLELIGDDLLDTGVAIMARPPGKRVAHISLLSGGEKALTAVSLVFAIFRLNPAPFCLLDEVDAPLDEANVGRFCQMVTEMTEHVQFIVVTHNKTTMEATRQLCGVTMREAGVSRLVQVDLAEAAKLAGAA